MIMIGRHFVAVTLYFLQPIGVCPNQLATNEGGLCFPGKKASFFLNNFLPKSPIELTNGKGSLWYTWPPDA